VGLELNRHVYRLFCSIWFDSWNLSSTLIQWQNTHTSHNCEFLINIGLLNCSPDGLVRYPCDSKAWKRVHERFPSFAAERRNVQNQVVLYDYSHFLRSWWPLVIFSWLRSTQFFLVAVNTVPGLSCVLEANAMTTNHIWCNQTSAQHTCVKQFMPRTCCDLLCSHEIWWRGSLQSISVTCNMKLSWNSFGSKMQLDCMSMKDLSH